jgi:hypothetical protein
MASNLNRIAGRVIRKLFRYKRPEGVHCVLLS